MERWRGKVAIVTGASCGIGAATARALTTHGMHVLALDIQENKLKELADELVRERVAGKLYPRKADLRKEEEILAAFDWADKELGGADVLFNNAGIAHTGYTLDGNVEEWRAMLDINVLAVLICTQLFLKSMKRRNNETGHIIIMDSVTGHLPPDPVMTVYAGTKYAIRGISMCLRQELAQRNSTIKVTTISPGAVYTDIWKDTVLQDLPSQIRMLRPEDVTEAVVDALSTSPNSQICDIILTPVPTKDFIY